MKLDRALTSYLKDLVKSGDLSASTIRTYRIALQSAVRFLDSQGVGDTEEITPRHLDAYETVSGSTAHGQNQRMRVLRKLLEFVRHRRGGKNNPFDGRKLPGYRSAPPLRHTRPSADLLKSIRGREPRDLRDRAMIAILLDLPPMSTGTLARLRNDTAHRRPGHRFLPECTDQPCDAQVPSACTDCHLRARFHPRNHRCGVAPECLWT